MNIIGLTKEEQDDIFRMLAIVLWLGNVQFSEGGDNNSAVVDDENGKLIEHAYSVGFDKRTKQMSICV
jgi:myosin I